MLNIWRKFFLLTFYLEVSWYMLIKKIKWNLMTFSTTFRLYLLNLLINNKG